MRKTKQDRYEIERRPGDLLYTARKRVQLADLPHCELGELGRIRTGRRRRENPVIQGYHEIITQPLYDTASVAVATAFPASTLFFQTPIGQVGKTLLQTNMTQAGLLPSPQKFSVRAFRLAVRNDANITDLINLLFQTFVLFKVSQKTYWSGPSALWTAGLGAYVSAAAEIGTAAAGDIAVAPASNGFPDQRNIFSLSRPIQIEQTEQFFVELDVGTAFTTVVAASRPLGTGLTIIAILDGELSRQVN